MKVLIAALFLQAGCASVTRNHWMDCTIICPMEVMAACTVLFKGKACKCLNGETYYVDEYDWSMSDFMRGEDIEYEEDRE